ncbi:MAG: hypothetical protein IJY94_06240 [Clostridia bacterium]|nr:hypothetical protein [Clostridia bacterium]
MTSENKDHEVNSTDSSYGGSTYRLSYDHEENKKCIKKSYGLRALIAVVVSIILLFVFAYLALRHYDDAIKKIYASETTPDNEKTSADFQSSINIVKN